jgi:hypothetical protein
LAATSKHDADVMIEALRRKRFESMAAEIPGKAGMYRVLVGPVRNGNVVKLRSDLEDAGFRGKTAFQRAF